MSSKSAYKKNSTDNIATLTALCELYESWFRALSEHATFDLWFKDADSRYTYVNNRFAESMGLAQECLLGQSPFEIFDSTERAQRVVAMDKQVMGESHLQRIIPCDGSGVLKMHEEHRFAVRNKEGDITGSGCFALEVSDRSFAEEALTQAQAIAKLGNWRWSIKEKSLISCSEQFAMLLGCSVKEAFSLMHDRINRVVHPEDRHIVIAATEHDDPSQCKAYQITYRTYSAGWGYTPRCRNC